MSDDILSESKNFTAANSGTNWNKKGSLATNAVNVVIGKVGTWKVHANVDFYIRGPHSATNAATTNDQFWVADDEVLVEVKRTNYQISLLKVSAAGTYHLNWLRGL